MKYANSEFITRAQRVLGDSVVEKYQKNSLYCQEGETGLDLLNYSLCTSHCILTIYHKLYKVDVAPVDIKIYQYYDEYGDLEFFQMVLRDNIWGGELKKQEEIK